MTELLSKNPNNREISDRVNTILSGGINSVGSFTLAPSATTTTVADYRAKNESKVIFSPSTLNAAANTTNTFVSSVSNNQFVVSHASTADTDKTFNYCLLG